MHRNQNFDIVFRWERDASLYRLFGYFLILPFPFSHFFFLWQWLAFYWACFQFKDFWESIIKTGNFYHRVAKCCCRKFCSAFFTQISEHFGAYLLHWANHSDLSITRNIFPSCRTWVYMMRILIKGDDVRSGTKANAHHSQLWLAQKSVG